VGIILLSFIWLSCSRRSHLHLHMSHSESRYSQPSSPTSTHARGRGRGHFRSRGELGKRIRARGPGYRGGHSAHGGESDRLDEAETAELEARYARRTIGTNADRYEEPDPEIGPDGMDSV
jgi:hypothetical protein